MCAKFGVDSSSCFPLGAWVHRQTDPHTVTDATGHPIPHISYASMG